MAVFSYCGYLWLMVIAWRLTPSRAPDRMHGTESIFLSPCFQDATPTCQDASQTLTLICGKAQPFAFTKLVIIRVHGQTWGKLPFPGNGIPFVVHIISQAKKGGHTRPPGITVTAGTDRVEEITFSLGAVGVSDHPLEFMGVFHLIYM